MIEPCGVDFESWRLERARISSEREERRSQREAVTKKAPARKRSSFCAHLYGRSGAFAYSVRIKELAYEGVQLAPLAGINAHWGADLGEGQVKPTWVRQIRAHLGHLDCPPESTKEVDELINPRVSHWIVSCLMCPFLSYHDVPKDIDPKRLRAPSRCPRCGISGVNLSLECVDNDIPSQARGINNVGRTVGKMGGHH